VLRTCLIGRDNSEGRTDGPESIFKTSEPITLLWALIEKKEPKGEFCIRTALNKRTEQHTHTHLQSGLSYTDPMNMITKKKQDDALFQGPCNTKDEKEAEEHLSMVFSPEIWWFGIYCVRCFLWASDPSQRKRRDDDHPRTFILGEHDKACSAERSDLDH
jgi:hypothetical protein